MIEPPIDEKALLQLRKHGIIISRMYILTNPDPSCINPNSVLLENKFMAFSSDFKLAVKLARKEVVETQRYYKNDNNNDGNGWHSFCQSFRQFKQSHLSNVPMSELTLHRKSQSKNHSDYPGFVA